MGQLSKLHTLENFLFRIFPYLAIFSQDLDSLRLSKDTELSLSNSCSSIDRDSLRGSARYRKFFPNVGIAREVLIFISLLGEWNLLQLLFRPFQVITQTFRRNKPSYDEPWRHHSNEVPLLLWCFFCLKADDAISVSSWWRNDDSSFSFLLQNLLRFWFPRWLLIVSRCDLLSTDPFLL